MDRLSSLKDAVEGLNPDRNELSIVKFSEDYGSHLLEEGLKEVLTQPSHLPKTPFIYQDGPSEVSTDDSTQTSS